MELGFSAGALLVVAFAGMLMAGVRARTPVGKARVRRLVIAFPGALFMTLLGCLFFLLQTATTPTKTFLAFLGVPFVQSIFYFRLSAAEQWLPVALFLGAVSWVAVFYLVLLVARFPGQRSGAEAQVHGPRRA